MENYQAEIAKTEVLIKNTIKSTCTNFKNLEENEKSTANLMLLKLHHLGEFSSEYDSDDAIENKQISDIAEIDV